MERTCVSCRHFTDGHYSRVYITPRCTVLGNDAAMYMRRKVCGIDDPKHWEPKQPETREGTEIEHGNTINSL